MYLIKKYYEATKNNKLFFNTEDAKKVWIHGKNNTFCKEKEFSMYKEDLIKDMGYSTKAAASRALKAQKELCKWENEYGYWVVTCELVEF